ncbi:dipeptide epimerase [bacterium]|nr:MAG: dipeptide epimerase [bacterium]
MADLKLELTRLEMPLKHTFTIARGSTEVARTLLFSLSDGERTGLGESSPVSRYGESIESLEAYWSAFGSLGDDPFDLQNPLTGHTPPAARTGLDIALHDLIGQRLGIPLWRYFGLDPARTPYTSFTVGIDDPAKMLDKVREVGEHPVLKVKLGTGNEIEVLRAIRGIYHGTIRIDANEGWTPERAVAVLREIEPLEIEFCEQPIPAGSPEQLRWIKERTKIPIVTDEDSCNASDLPKLYGCVDGINVKLVKCGGIRGALEMIHTARACNFKIMLGCMVESGILQTAAAHLSPLVDWADLDGAFLLRENPYVGMTYRNGKIMLPDAPGLGVHPASALAR